MVPELMLDACSPEGISAGHLTNTLTIVALFGGGMNLLGQLHDVDMHFAALLSLRRVFPCLLGLDIPQKIQR